MTRHLIVLLDASNSMNKIKPSVIDGFNMFLRDRRAFDPTTLFTLVEFDEFVRPPGSTLPLSDVPSLTSYSYRPSGWTSMYDAIGYALTVRGPQIELYSAPSEITCAILTDGDSNRDKQFTKTMARQCIDAARARGWTFIFLAANIDAERESDDLGFDRAATHAFTASAEGVHGAFRNASRSARIASMCL